MPLISLEAILFDPDPSAYLPHRPPFLFIDRLVTLDSGVAATGEFAVSAAGYFPPILLVEAMAQLGGIAAGQRQGEGGVLAALERVELPAAVAPHARLLIYSKVLRSFGGLIQIAGEARQDDTVIASAQITLAVGMR